MGISIPQNATKNDLIDLISFNIDNDEPSTERQKNFAKEYGVNFTKHVGKKALFNRIQAALSSPGWEIELISWFIFRVYRTLVNRANDAPIACPSDPTVLEIAMQLLDDEKVIKSIRRYEGEDLIWFKKWTEANGYSHDGGSTNTIAYKQVSSMLRERISLPRKKSQKKRKSTVKRSGFEGWFRSFLLRLLK